MCGVLSVSQSGYYKWKKKGDGPQKWQDVLVKIYKVLDEDKRNDNYGVNRMKIALEKNGVFASRNTIRKAMRAGNLLKKSHRSPDGLTKADKKANRPKNIIKRDFKADKPNEKWLTDITQVSCKNGKLYIMPVFDCFSGEIVSIGMDTNMKKEMCIKAMEEAFKARKPKNGIIVHSDAGSQYTSDAFRAMLAKYKAVQSMSDVGKCYDNARMESWNATLKKELIYRMDTMKKTVEEVKTAVFRFSMIYYNRIRITTMTPNFAPPSIYREQFEKGLLIAA